MMMAAHAAATEEQRQDVVAAEGDQGVEETQAMQTEHQAGAGAVSDDGQEEQDGGLPDLAELKDIMVGLKALFDRSDDVASLREIYKVQGETQQAMEECEREPRRLIRGKFFCVIRSRYHCSPLCT